MSDLETVDELRLQLREGLVSAKLSAVRTQFRDRVLDDMLADLELEIPPALIGAETESSLHNLAHSLQANGLDLATYLSVTGQDQQEFADQVRADAERSLRVRVVLEAVATAEGITVADQDIVAAITQTAAASGRYPGELARLMAESGQGQVLAGDILRRRALDRIMEASTAVDGEGSPVDLGAPAGEEPANEEMVVGDVVPDPMVEETPTPEGDSPEDDNPGDDDADTSGSGTDTSDDDIGAAPDGDTTGGEEAR